MGKQTFAGLIFFILTLMGSELLAQGLNDYRSIASTNWANASTWERFDGTNWVAAAVPPGSGDGVITIRSTFTVTVAAIVTADQVVVESGGTLILNSTLNLNDGAGIDLLVQGNMNWSSGTLGGPGVLEIASGGTLTFTSTSSKFVGASITNNGTIEWQDGNVSYNTSSPLVNNSILNISGNNQMSSNSGTFNLTNTGTITKTSAGTTIFNSGGSFNNSGTINLNNGLLRSQSFAFTNTGNLTLSGGNFELLGGSFSHNTGSVISGTGNFTNAGGDLILTSDLVFPSTLIYSHQLGITGNPRISGAGNLTINNDFTILGTISGAGSLSINANTTWTSGSMGRVFTNQASRTLTIVGDSQSLFLGAGGSLTNNGTLNWQSGNIAFNSSSPLVNNGTLNISGNNQMSSNSGTFNLTNTGTITKTSTGTTLFNSGGSFSNSGTINLNNGLLRSQNLTVTQTGNLTFTGGSFELLGGSFSHNSGSVISGTGNFTNTGGDLRLNIDQVFPSTLIFADGPATSINPTISGTGNLTINNDFEIRGTITGSGTLTINANTSWTSGSMGRVFTNQANRTLTINGGSQSLFLGAGGSLTNNGTLNWQGGNIAFNSSSPLVNNNIMNISGNNQMSTNSGTFNLTNSGTITKTSTGTTTFSSGGSFANSGTIKGLGTFNLNIPTNNTGIIAPGLSPGILTLNTQQPFGANSTLQIEIEGNAGAGVANGHDQVQRAGNLTLAGTLTVAETGAVPDGDYVIVSLTSGNITGTFSTTNLPASYTVVYNSTNVVLRKAVQQPSQYRSILSGDWTTPSTWERFNGTNWVPATVSPTSEDGQITIRSPHNVTLAVAFSSISVDEVLVESGATITNSSANGQGFIINNGVAEHDMVIEGNLVITSGTLSGAGTLLVKGTMSWNTAFNAVGNDISAPTIISSTGVVNTGGSYVILNGPMTNNGTFNLSNGALGFRPNGAFTNHGTFNITHTATDFGFQGTAPGFFNSTTGVITKSSSGNFTVGTNSFNNSGTLNINAGTWLINSGVTFENTGSITLSNNSLFHNSGGSVQLNSGTSFSGTGIYRQQGGSSSFNTVVSFPSTLALEFLTGAMNGSGSLTVNGVMNWNSGFGSHSFLIPTTISNTGTLNIGGSYAVLGSSLTNNGTANLTSGVLGFGTNGGFSNNGAFNITNTATDFGFQGSGPGFINNSTGVVTKSNEGSFTIGVLSSNSGLIKGIGTLQLNTTFTNTGKINPGLSPGILVLNGTQPLSASSTLEIEIEGNAGAGLANGHDQVQRAGNLTLAGTLTVAETGSVPDGDYTIILTTTGSITGTFTTTNLPANYTVVYNSNSVVIRKAQPVVNVTLSGALSGNFTTLAAAFQAINSNSGSGDVTVTIRANTTETSQAVLLQTNYTVTVVPEGNRTVSGNLSTPLVLLNGADNVTIDGLSFDGNNRLTIRNTNTNADANAVRIFGSANNNTVKRCTLEGSGVGINFFTGIIALSSSNADFSENNTIDNNLIRPASSSGASNGIMVSTLNSTNTGKIVNARITNNRIENVFINNVNDVNHGIVAGFNVDNITIQGNSVYNTATFSNTRNNSFYYGIRITNSSGGTGSGSIVSDNFIGGTEPEAKGGKMVISSSANSLNFSGILINDNTNAPNKVTGNVVKNIDLDIANPSSSQISPFIGIRTLTGIIQEYHHNSVGDSLVNNSILLTMRPASTGTISSFGHVIQVPVATEIANNFTGGLTIITHPIAGSTVAPGFYSFSINGNHPTFTLRKNKIGSDLEGSITVVSNTAGSFIFRGLFTQSSNINPTSVLDQNTIQNIQTTNRMDLSAISYTNNTSSASPNVSITNNKIQKIRVSGTGGGLSGIFFNSNGSITNLSQTLQISGNQLSDLEGVSGTGLILSGIQVQNLSTDVNRIKGSVKGNTVSTLNNFSGGSTGLSRGISIIHDISLGDSLVIAENLIEKISSATEFVTTTNSGTSMGLSYGTLNSGTNGFAILRDNTVREISTTSTANLDLTAFGISLFGNNILVERNKVFQLTNAATSASGRIVGIFIRSRSNDAGTGRVQNNMVALSPTTSVRTMGIQLADGLINTQVYHNSILLEGNSPTSSYGLFKSATAKVDLKNTILYNAFQGSGTAYSLGLETNTTGYTGNNNYLVSPAAASLAEIGGAAQTLTSWRSSTSQDSDSREAESGITTISENLFTDKSVADLLIKVENIGEASRISDKGIAIPTVTNDFQGEARNATTPDIGADEFELTGVCVPEVSIAANPGNEVCEGTSVTFTATPVNGGDAPVYQWKLNGNNVGTNAPTYTNAALANGDQVSVVMTSSAACASPTSATSNTVTMTVTSTLVPSVSIAANPGNQICTGTSVTFTATPV
ncbi:hypothetical protein CLV31_11357, partial [Algoriphagus aquaeductus]